MIPRPRLLLLPLLAALLAFHHGLMDGFDQPEAQASECVAYATTCSFNVDEARAPSTAPADEPTFTREQDVIYGRKYGTALTLDVFTPKKDANGLGIIFVVSGGWFSAHEIIGSTFVKPLTDRGYTVFAVVHGSQPKFTIPEILQDMNRAVRFIRHNAEKFAIDPNHVGICGGSAGGHLSLMQGTAGDAGNPNDADPVNRESSRVQAIACFYPPTDFLNYGKPGEHAIGQGILKNYRAPFDFHKLDTTKNQFIPITDENEINSIAKEISPIYHVSPDDPPTLILHGDADTLVPIQQAQTFLEQLHATGVETKLITKPGAGHGWPKLETDMTTFADWFDAHLKPTPQAQSASK